MGHYFLDTRYNTHTQENTSIQEQTDHENEAIKTVLKDIDKQI